MALKKKIKSRSGINLEYWKIGSWFVDTVHKTVDINLIPYYSSKTRNEGLEPINEEIRKIRAYDLVNKIDEKKSVLLYSDYFSPEAISAKHANIYEIMYLFIKQTNKEFKEAEDV
jgi:hypothetical protein